MNDRKYCKRKIRDNFPRRLRSQEKGIKSLGELTNCRTETNVVTLILHLFKEVIILPKIITAIEPTL